MGARISFGEFVLDGTTRQLLRGHAELHLEPKAFELLALLLDRRPAAVSKREIRDQLWPQTYVSESSLTGLVTQIRRVLEDRRSPRLVRTVQRFGYAFSGEASPVGIAVTAAAQPSARVIWEERTIALGSGENILGRAADVAVRIDLPGVSRHHARIVIDAAGATLEDLGSKNGTYLAERRLPGPATLQDGDTLRLGRHLLVFRSSQPATSTLTDPFDQARAHDPRQA